MRPPNTLEAIYRRLAARVESVRAQLEGLAASVPRTERLKLESQLEHVRLRLVLFRGERQALGVPRLGEGSESRAGDSASLLSNEIEALARHLEALAARVSEQPPPD